MPSKHNTDEYGLALIQRHKEVVPLPLQIVAQVISILFHPLFILCYAYVLLAIFNPFLFESEGVCVRKCFLFSAWFLK